ncbi:MAG: hypothetical protein P8020_03000 [Acidobacteriota bacterium]
MSAIPRRRASVGSWFSSLLTAINALSLDAPLVAVSWQWLFADATRTSLEWKYYLILGGSVWCLYVLDRVLDGWRLPPEGAASARHEFARRHLRRLLVSGVAATVLMVVLCVMLLPLGVLLNWTALALAVAGYFILVHWLRPTRMVLPKEVLVAALFTAGSTLFVLTAHPPQAGAILVPASGALLLFFGNACSISKWERSFDGSSQQSSIAIEFPHLIRLLPWYLAGLGGSALLLPILGVVSWRIGVCVGVGSLLLWGIDRFGSNLGVSERREMADLALLTPLLAAIFG